MLFRTEIQYFWREEYTGFSDDVSLLFGKQHCISFTKEGEMETWKQPFFPHNLSLIVQQTEDV